VQDSGLSGDYTAALGVEVQTPMQVLNDAEGLEIVTVVVVYTAVAEGVDRT